MLLSQNSKLFTKSSWLGAWAVVWPWNFPIFIRYSLNEIYPFLRLQDSWIFFSLTYGNINSWLNEWNEIYNLRLLTCSLFLIRFERLRVSGSENGFGPAYVSEHGFDDAPVSAWWKSKFLFGSVPIQNIELGRRVFRHNRFWNWYKNIVFYIFACKYFRFPYSCMCILVSVHVDYWNKYPIVIFSQISNVAVIWKNQFV